MVAAAAPAAAAEITYGRLRVTTATRGCSCSFQTTAVQSAVRFLLVTICLGFISLTYNECVILA